MKIPITLILLGLFLSTKALSISTESNLKRLNQEINRIDSERSIWIDKDKLKDEIKALSSGYNTYNKACSDEENTKTQLCESRKKNLKSEDLELYQNNCSVKKQGSIEASRKCILLIQSALNNLTGHTSKVQVKESRHSSVRKLAPVSSSSVIDTLIEPFEVKLNKKQNSTVITEKRIKNKSSAKEFSSIGSSELENKKNKSSAQLLPSQIAYQIKNKNILHNIWKEKLDLPDSQKQSETFMSQIRLLGRKQLKIYTEWCLNEVLPSSSDDKKRFELEGLNQFNNKCSAQFNRLYTLCLNEEVETENKCSEVNSVRALDQQIYQINEVLSDV